MRKWIRIVASLVTFAVASPLFAAEETNREVVRTLVQFYFSVREYRSALRALEEHIASDPKDAEAVHWLGLTHMQLQNYYLAASAFEQAMSARVAPDRYYSAYLWADALNRQGKLVEARGILEQLSAAPEAHDFVRDVLETLRSREPLPELEMDRGPRWSVYLKLGGGYDANPMLISNSALQTISVSDAASWTQGFLAHLTRAHQFPRDELLFSSSSNVQWYWSDSARDFSSVSQNMTGVWRTRLRSDRTWSYGAAASLDAVVMNPNSLGLFSLVPQIRPQSRWWLNPDLTLEGDVLARYQYFPTNSGSSVDRSGLGFRSQWAFQHRLSRGSLRWGVNADIHLAQDADFRVWAIQVPLELRWSLPLRLEGRTSLGATMSNYYENSEGRQDQGVQVGIGLSYPLSRVFLLGWDADLNWNHSTTEASSFLRWSSSLAISAMF